MFAIMAQDQLIIIAILVFSMGMFIWGRWRYDIVALIALMATVACGAVPYRDTFLGFANPAVITVAAVMVFAHRDAHRQFQKNGLIKVISVASTEDFGLQD